MFKIRYDFHFETLKLLEHIFRDRIFNLNGIVYAMEDWNKFTQLVAGDYVIWNNDSRYVKVVCKRRLTKMENK